MSLAFHQISTQQLQTKLQSDIRISVLRLDKIHPVISGNKWFKLSPWLDDAIKLEKKRIITFGGAYSNHILATAAIAKASGLASIGVIRGELPIVPSYTLQEAAAEGMKLYFTDRNSYRDKKIPFDLSENDYVIPEGGYGEKGAAGAEDILQHAEEKFTHYCCAVGTGTMMAGIINSIPENASVIGISTMKNNEDLEANVSALVKQRRVWKLNHDYHFGGYAKEPKRLFEFMNEFYATESIPSDFVYTGKLFYAVIDLEKKGFFPPNSQVLMIHSGGLQGNASLRKGTLIF